MFFFSFSFFLDIFFSEQLKKQDVHWSAWKQEIAFVQEIKQSITRINIHSDTQAKQHLIHFLVKQEVKSGVTKRN